MKYGNQYNPSTDIRSVLDSIRRIVHALRVGSRQAERDVGLSAAQLFVLDRLAASNGPLSVNDLAEATLTHQSSVSVVVQKLERRGLIERAHAADDARRMELSLTPDARKLLSGAPPAAQQHMIDALLAMPASKRATLAALLVELSNRLGAETPPVMFFEDHREQKKRGSPRARS